METIKEEKKADLEQLLNSLIEKGWKPFGDYDIADFNQIGNTFVARNYESKVIGQPKLRQIVSKESGLWQFVCENEMIRNEKLTHNWVSQVEWGLDVDCKRKTTPKNYEYRLIESSLKDESELEDFLLSNIKVNAI